MVLLVKSINTPPMHEIKQAILDFFQIDERTLCGKQRYANIIRARHYFCYLSREDLYPTPTYEQIGLEIGKNHATALHAHAKYKGYQTAQEQSEILQIRAIIESYKIPEISPYYEMFANMGYYS